MEKFKEMTNEELNSFIDELNEKFGKLRKVANKLAIEMDSIVDQYNAVMAELTSRKGKN